MVRGHDPAYRILSLLAGDDRGSIAVPAALLLMVLLAFAGGTLDLTLAMTARMQMQQAADATVIAMSKEAVSDTQAKLTTNGQSFFYANLPHGFGVPPKVTMTYTPPNNGGATVKVNADTTLNTYFLHLIGIPTIDVGVTSTSTWGSTRLRVGLVLDNTGSMAQSGKMTALKAASHNLLKQLQSAVNTDGDVYVSIVPFAKDVNVGASNYGASWIDWSLWDQANTYYDRPQRKWVTPSHSSWNGCVTDRTQNNDTTNAAPTSANSATLFPAEQDPYCPLQLVSLTYDWSTLNQTIDQMYPSGNTNQSIGLQWGFQSLTAAPFTIPAFDKNYTYKQVIILLTDGLNTQNRWTNNRNMIDARQKILCDNIKSTGITIYTIQVNTDHEATSTLLQNCASDTGKFFLLTSASEILTVFDKIGSDLSQLRVSH